MWVVTPASWRNWICAIVVRNITREEWSRFIPGDEYRATCPQWSLEAEVTLAATP